MLLEPYWPITNPYFAFPYRWVLGSSKYPNKHTGKIKRQQKQRATWVRQVFCLFPEEIERMSK